MQIKINIIYYLTLVRMAIVKMIKDRVVKDVKKREALLVGI
jgi:hypothetical protein